MRRRAPYKRHTTVCRVVVGPFRAMSLLFSCCSSADNSLLFLPLCDMRTQAVQRSNSFDVAVGRATLAPRHVPFSGPLAGQYATLVGIVTAIFAKAAACKWRDR